MMIIPTSAPFVKHYFKRSKKFFRQQNIVHHRQMEPAAEHLGIFTLAQQPHGFG